MGEFYEQSAPLFTKCQITYHIDIFSLQVCIRVQWHVNLFSFSLFLFFVFFPYCANNYLMQKKLRKGQTIQLLLAAQQFLFSLQTEKINKKNDSSMNKVSKLVKKELVFPNNTFY